jgi:hypothetical protein
LEVTLARADADNVGVGRCIGTGDEAFNFMDEMPFERDAPPPPSTVSSAPVARAAAQEDPSARSLRAMSDPLAPRAAPAFIAAAAAASAPAAAPAAASVASPSAVAQETPAPTRADMRTSTAPPPPPAAPAAPMAENGSATASKIDPSTLTEKGIDLLLSGLNY